MRYPEELVTPMRQELTDHGFEELKTADAVESFIQDKTDSAIVVLNSVCGCAAGGARPGIKKSIEESDNAPKNLATIFAGQDAEATQAIRDHFAELPPSSPCAYVFKDGKLLNYYPRHRIEGFSADEIAENLKEIYQSL